VRETHGDALIAADMQEGVDRRQDGGRGRRSLLRQREPPLIAASMSASVGFGFAFSSATAARIWPDWQYPHCTTSASVHAFWTG
jgi:hypothetical protein